MLNQTDIIKTQGKIEVENVTFRHEQALEAARAKRDLDVALVKERTELLKDKIEHIENLYKTLIPHLASGALKFGDSNAANPVSEQESNV